MGTGTAQSVKRLATGWTAQGSEFEYWYRRFVFSRRSPERFREPNQPPAQWLPKALSPWVKRLGREA
jgi:hypothetical protein